MLALCLFSCSLSALKIDASEGLLLGSLHCGTMALSGVHRVCWTFAPALPQMPCGIIPIENIGCEVELMRSLINLVCCHSGMNMVY